MKFKELIVKYIIPLAVFICVTGCSQKNENIEKDYSKYAFTDISWTREGEHDTETIRFDSDGSFHYSCGCGNPVNDADLCEGYTYDDKTKTITLTYIEETPETIDEIIITQFGDDYINLSFNGEIRSFVREKPHKSALS